MDAGSAFRLLAEMIAAARGRNANKSRWPVTGALLELPPPRARTAPSVDRGRGMRLDACRRPRPRASESPPHGRSASGDDSKSSRPPCCTQQALSPGGQRSITRRGVDDLARRRPRVAIPRSNTSGLRTAPESTPGSAQDRFPESRRASPRSGSLPPRSACYRGSRAPSAGAPAWCARTPDSAHPPPSSCLRNAPEATDRQRENSHPTRAELRAAVPPCRNVRTRSCLGDVTSPSPRGYPLAPSAL